MLVLIGSYFEDSDSYPLLLPSFLDQHDGSIDFKRSSHTTDCAELPVEKTENASSVMTIESEAWSSGPYLG